jgi:hypothetical protein
VSLEGHAGAANSVSDHSLLANTFFITAQPTIAFNIRQLRGQVYNVSDTHAGNYQVTIPYTEYDYASPALLEKSHSTLKRCGQYSLAALLGGSWNSTYSVMTNWSCFYTDPVNFGDGLKVRSSKLW